MSKLDGEFVPLRKDIRDHLKSMSLSEIALFVAYLVVPMYERVEDDGTITGMTDPTIQQLEEILPIGKTTIIYAKQALAARGFIKKVGQSKVEIPKFKKLKGSHFEPYSSDSEPLEGGAYTEESAKSSKVEPYSSIIEPKSSKVEPSKEEEIELTTSTSGTGQATQTELMSLQTVKGVKDYPFDYETDLAHLRNLSVDFPEVDIHEQVKKWAAYKLDHPLGKKGNPRLQLRNWMEKSREFAAKRPGSVPNEPKGFSGLREWAGKRGVQA